jgi:hypothetical protein
VQQLGRGGQEPVGRHVHALALDGLDDERGDVALAQLGRQRVQVPERDSGVREQWSEPLLELGRAVH